MRWARCDRCTRVYKYVPLCTPSLWVAATVCPVFLLSRLAPSLLSCGSPPVIPISLTSHPTRPPSKQPRRRSHTRSFLHINHSIRDFVGKVVHSLSNLHPSPVRNSFTLSQQSTPAPDVHITLVRTTLKQPAQNTPRTSTLAHKLSHFETHHASQSNISDSISRL